ncbi:DUF362 domain-containing protein [bacterium]|jgi:uncharacterized protein (DUF362 family)|nr:DUF362 domain-containing protein [bacterium]
MADSNHDPSGKRPFRLSRRNLIVGTGGAAVIGGATAFFADRFLQPADVFIAKASDYHVDIASIVRHGFAELGITRRQIAGKSILLKPNLVEPATEAPHINTHPVFIHGVATAFLSMGAREIIVAEGPGHCRDTYLVLDESGMSAVLRDSKMSFVDLNHDDVDVVANHVGKTSLKELFLPQTLRRADWIVSLPKMKTHHWVGATLSMKNFFGVLPGICYGWPKNVLHREGIDQSIVDIVGTVKPHLAIVDGIVAMEGDGPVMGDPKIMQTVVMGTNLPAVDATCCRLMKLDPGYLAYLSMASRVLGPIAENRIVQRGETIASMAQLFRLVDDPMMAKFRPV